MTMEAMYFMQSQPENSPSPKHDLPQSAVHVRWVNHGMACPQVADGGDALQLWRADANILNK
jgi:hypothetical protein